jgi:type IV pilus assembly protein PilO
MTDKNKSVIIALGIIVLVLLYYFFPYKMLEEDKSSLKLEVQKLTLTYNALLTDINKEDQYREDMETFNEENEIIAAMLPQELPQERLIYIVNDLEDYLDIEIANVSLGTQETLFTLDTNSVLGSEYAISNEIKTTIACSYSQLKELIDYVNNNEDRMVLKDLSIVSNDSEGDLKVAFGLEFYGLEISGREPEELDLGEFEIGKNGVFDGFDGYTGGTNTPYSSSSNQLQDDKADFYVSLSPIISDKTSVIIGKGDDVSSVTAVYYDDNSATDIEFVLTQSDGVYYYKYKAGNDTYPNDYSTAVAFDPGSTLEILISSDDRIGDSDLSGANATIINNTDMPVNIVYYKEDFDNPRFTLGYTEGEVIVH